MALYKQTKQAVTITVVGKGISGGRGKSAATKKPNEDSEEEKTRKMNSAKRIAIKTAVNFATRTAPNFIIGNISAYTGDSNFQAEVQRKQEIVSDVISTSVNTIVGFAINPALGAIQLTTSLVSNAMKYEQRNINQSVQEFKQTQSVNYAKARSGIDLTDGRTRLR